MKEDKKENIALNHRERLMAFIYVLLFFLITTGSCCLIIHLATSNYGVSNHKYLVLSKIDKVKKYRAAQDVNRLAVDSLYSRIAGFDPKINASYEEDDIIYMLNDLRNIYQNNSWDNRYKVFLHVADFYQMWLTDRKELWSIKQNISNFKTNLEACEVGLESKKQDLRSNVKK